MKNSKRIAELDGLRAFAALIVILFHYFYRWREVLPYGFALDPIARFGFLGVNLFFIISGFVIFMSLERCPTVFIFAKQRAIRLMPAMLVCSVITFVAMRMIDTPFTEMRRQHWTGFLPSWTFTPPKIWQILVPVGGWMDGVYWTLYVELKFYVLAATLYFFSGHRFFRVGFLVLLVMGALANHLFASGPGMSLIVEHGLFPRHLPFFCAGIALYDIHQRRVGMITLVILMLSIALAIAAMNDLPSRMIAAAFFAIFFIVIFRPIWVKWLADPSLVAIGIASYPLYLLHQNLGVALMSLVPSSIMQSWFYMIAVCVTGAIILLSFSVHRWVEKPVEQYFNRRRQVYNLTLYKPDL